jgi:Right handed beta helix region
MVSARLMKGLAGVIAVAVAVTACGGGDDDDGASAVATTHDAGTQVTGTPATTTPATISQVPTTQATDAAPATTAPEDGVREVPGEYPTIQAAVDAAAEGDLVLIAPGVYNEAVDVVTNNLTIRGLDRDGVVLDGQLELDNGIRVLGATGVAVENLTAVNYTANGVFFTGTTGYRASFVTTYRTGDYGIYAFDSTKGQIDNSHTVGSRDGGVYIGQCFPCDALIDQVLSEHNGLGYSGTNSGGNLLIVNSTFRNNRAGLVPNSGSYELCYPERETTIVGNLVYSNNQPDTPAIDVALLAQGNGILLPGGVRNLVARNRVFDHNRTGIGLVPFLEEDPNDDLPTPEEWSTPCAEQKNQIPATPSGALLWNAYENEITGNVVSDSGEADLAVASAGEDISTFRNCFADNEFATTAPHDLQALAPCEGAGSGGDWTAGDLNVARWIGDTASLPGEVDWKIAPLPELGAHENMPDAATAPSRPATDVPMAVDLDAITVPDAPK